MKTTGLRVGDVVEAKVRGITFKAQVIDVTAHSVDVEPLDRWATWRRLSARQVLRRVERQERIA